jgi:hypothetical protein
MKQAGLLIKTAVAFLIGCSDSKPKESDQKTCVEPENPYDEGTGHYAGYAWAEENGATATVIQLPSTRAAKSITRKRTSTKIAKPETIEV